MELLPVRAVELPRIAERVAVRIGAAEEVDGSIEVRHRSLVSRARSATRTLETPIARDPLPRIIDGAFGYEAPEHEHIGSQRSEPRVEALLRDVRRRELGPVGAGPGPGVGLEPARHQHLVAPGRSHRGREPTGREEARCELRPGFPVPRPRVRKIRGGSSTRRTAEEDQTPACTRHALLRPEAGVAGSSANSTL